MPKYSGVPVWIGERRLVVPALSVMQIRAHRPVLSRYQTFGTQEPTDEELEKLIDCIGDAVRRNYPEVTSEWLAAELDMRSIPETMRALINQSELEVVRPGEAEASS